MYLNDRHQRRQDREYREPAERQRLELENEQSRLRMEEDRIRIGWDYFELLREMGVPDDEIRRVIWEKGWPPSDTSRPPSRCWANWRRMDVRHKHTEASWALSRDGMSFRGNPLPSGGLRPDDSDGAERRRPACGPDRPAADDGQPRAPR